MNDEGASASLNADILTETSGREAAGLLHLSKALKYLGPAFVVSVAYMDPGNFGPNITAGSSFGYTLLWVIFWSNVFAIFLQILSAKLGIATGKDLPTLCREVFPKRTNVALWIIGVAASMATNLAEVVGGALGFYLLFGIPPFWGAALTAALGLGISGLSRYGQQKVEMAISGLVSVISLCFVVELLLVKPEWPKIALHTLVPQVGRQSLLVATGMLGATVMPHVIYLHSGLVQSRRNGTLQAMREHLALEKVDVCVAMNVAFIINAAMVIVSSATFHRNGIMVDSIEVAHRMLEPLLGSLSSTAFGIALLASGLSSTSVGTLAGQAIMEGFIEVRLPVWVERVITVLPALAVVAVGVDPMEILVLSQVILSFALPAAIIPLLLITGDRRIMGPFRNDSWTSICGFVICGIIIVLNAALLLSSLAA